MRTATVDAFRVTVEGERATWERRAIARGGKKLTWMPALEGRWDEKQGFWGGLPYGLTEAERMKLEAAIRAAAT